MTNQSPRAATNASKVRGDLKTLPFSSSVLRNKTIYVSGLIPADDRMNLSGTTIEEQTRAVMEKLVKELARHGADLSNVVKTTVLLANADRDWPRMNEVYREYMAPLAVKPARESYGVELAAKELLVEISAIAVLE